MIVYLETNFLVELALQREQAAACRRLLDWSMNGHGILRLPVCALIEGQAAFRRRKDERLATVKALQRQGDDFHRLHESAALAAECEHAARVLLEANRIEDGRFAELMQRAPELLSLIPVDGRVARLIEMLRASHVLTGEGDLLVLASILRDLQERERTGVSERSLFVTRDADFGKRARELLRPYSSDLLHSYEAAVSRLETNE